MCVRRPRRWWAPSRGRSGGDGRDAGLTPLPCSRSSLSSPWLQYNNTIISNNNDNMNNNNNDDNMISNNN